MSIKETDNKTGGARFVTGLITEEALYKKSPQELTALLYEACITNLEKSIEAINKKDYLEANEKLKKSNDILHRLGAGLNYEGGIIADQLDALYNYMADKLIEANIKKEVKLIEEVLNSLTVIANAWNQTIKKKTNVNSQGNRRNMRAYEQNVMTLDDKGM